MRTIAACLALGLLWAVPGLAQDPSSTKDGGGPLWGFLRIRNDSTGQITDLQQIENGKPAQVQFIQDRQAGTDVWNVDIAAFMVKTLYSYASDPNRPDAGGNHLSSAVLLPTLVWNRLSGVGAKDVNLLTAKLGAAAVFFQPTGPAQEVRLYADYSRDAVSGGRFMDGELFYEAIYQPWGLGAFNTSKSLSLAYRWKLEPGLTGRHVFDAGTDPKLAAHRQNLWLSPRAELAIHSTADGWNRLKLTLSYAYDWGWAGSLGKIYLFTGDLSGALDDQGHYTAELTYKKGSATLIQVPVDQTQLGIGIKY